MEKSRPGPTSVSPAEHLLLAAARYGFISLAVVVVFRMLAAVGLFPGPWMRSLGFVLVAAFPVALVLAHSRPWIDLPESETGEAPADSGARLWAGAGIAALVCAGWLALGGVGDAEDPGSAPSATPEARVLVLPLIDLDGRGDRYFADGLTDELVAGLAAVESLEVRGRSSAATQLDVNRSPAELAPGFGAAVSLDGTVRRSGDRLRINVRLIDAATGEPIWSATRDTALAALFDVRDEVVSGVAEALGLELTPSTVRRLERRRTGLQALDLYMLGRFRWAEGPGGDLAEAAAYYHLAIEADSAFAPAWTALATTYATLPRFTNFSPDVARRDGAAAARTALQLAPGSAGAHAALGEILYLYERDWEGARSHLRRAIELDPGDAGPLDRMCEMSLVLGEIEAARQSCGAARVRDPLAFRPAWLMTRIERTAGDGEVGLVRLDSLAAQFPDFEPLAAELALARLATPEPNRSEDLTRDGLRRWLALLTGEATADTLSRTIATAAGAETPSQAVGAAADRMVGDLQPDPAYLAALLAQIGRLERAVEIGAAAFAERVPGTLAFGVLPEFEPLRGAPEIASMLEELGLPRRTASGSGTTENTTPVR